MLLLCALACAAAQADDSFRCGNELIVAGMTQADVLQQCGPPTSKSEEIAPVRSGKQVVGQTTTQRWTYQSYGATRVLVFDQDVLKAVE